MVCLRTFSTVAPIFESVAINDPDLLTLLERAARHHLEQNSLFGRRIIQHLDDDCFSFADVSQQSQVVINVRLLHGQQIPVFPLKYSTLAAVPSVSVGRNKSMHLNGLDQFALRRDLGVRFLAFKHADTRTRQ